ncbi:glucuronate isomerase [Bacillus licheniformis]|nr:glucuronate isomerase [Bacillus licheniformis]
MESNEGQWNIRRVYYRRCVRRGEIQRLGKNGSDDDWKPALSLDPFGAEEVFGIDDRLDEKSAPHIWERVNEQLAGGGFGARDLIENQTLKRLSRQMTHRQS